MGRAGRCRQSGWQRGLHPRLASSHSACVFCLELVPFNCGTSNISTFLWKCEHGDGSKGMCDSHLQVMVLGYDVGNQRSFWRWTTQSPASLDHRRARRQASGSSRTFCIRASWLQPPSPLPSTPLPRFAPCRTPDDLSFTALALCSAFPSSCNCASMRQERLHQVICFYRGPCTCLSAAFHISVCR